ncbi:unannotated protein [freshwater metagenome]|uniref:Unannotated protein n=1 Tax=freshwater metagenome TaxID=449393 RepID=A0A6J6GEQ0_9ZZZZ
MRSASASASRCIPTEIESASDTTWLSLYNASAGLAGRRDNTSTRSASSFLSSSVTRTACRGSIALRARFAATSMRLSSSHSSSMMPRLSASDDVRSLFPLTGLSTKTVVATFSPTSRGSNVVPPQPGSSPRLTSGKPRALMLLVATRAEQCSESSNPPPRATPLMAATTGTPSWPSRPNTR